MDAREEKELLRAINSRLRFFSYPLAKLSESDHLTPFEITWLLQGRSALPAYFFLSSSWPRWVVSVDHLAYVLERTLRKEWDLYGERRMDLFWKFFEGLARNAYRKGRPPDRLGEEAEKLWEMAIASKDEVALYVLAVLDWVPLRVKKKVLHAAQELDDSSARNVFYALILSVDPEKGKEALEILELLSRSSYWSVRMKVAEKVFFPHFLTDPEASVRVRCVRKGLSRKKALVLLRDPSERVRKRLLAEALTSSIPLTLEEKLQLYRSLPEEERQSEWGRKAWRELCAEMEKEMGKTGKFLGDLLDLDL